ncbi:uncharacterized protein LOC126605696 [Malus sylvestris]|uniref:uncharacterized protein LOC126605696 n=1 Tax=Malus sylvestris TaxID=3752 RepID=UPI0021AC207E|nr:uncharacterized protein LOC126605696 [Malus sylvestris]
MGSQPLPSASDEQLASKLLLINDLPDGVLVEILCRLPYKYARRNKRVCKRWLALISDSYFAGRFLCMQIDKNKPITLLRTLLFSNRTAKPSPAGFTFRHIIFDALLWKTSIVALHFIPRFKGTKEKLVVAMYNDLVLCCLTKEDPHKYYICNPNAMQCVALPPAPPHHKIAQVGFICDPYYASQEQDNGGGSLTTNDEYRCRVVRIIQLGNYLSQFKVDIFSSETSEWRESVVSCPQQSSISFGFTFSRPGIAYNGMLYWPSYGGVIGFDPFAPHSSNYGCRFIEFDEPLDYTMTVACLGICRGRLRMCQLQTWMPPETLYNPYNNGRPLIVCISELKEDGAAGGGRVKWCLIHKASLDEMDVGKHVFINDCIRFRYKIRVLAVDPNDGDILYLEMCGYIIKCNIQARTLEKPRGQRFGRNAIDFGPWRDVWTYVIPCWPTPLPRVGLPPLSRKRKREEKQTAIVS